MVISRATQQHRRTSRRPSPRWNEAASAVVDDMKASKQEVSSKEETRKPNPTNAPPLAEASAPPPPKGWKAKLKALAKRWAKSVVFSTLWAWFEAVRNRVRWWHVILLIFAIGLAFVVVEDFAIGSLRYATDREQRCPS